MYNNLIIKKENMSDDIIKRIIYIDKIFYNEDLSFEYYKERYNLNDIVYCLYHDNDIVGYVSMYGIKKSLYDDLKKGLYDSDYDFDVNLLEQNSNYIYISSIVIIEKYRYCGYGLKLLDKVLNEKGKKYIAMSISNDGFKLLNKRMNLVKKVTDEVFIFVSKDASL